MSWKSYFWCWRNMWLTYHSIHYKSMLKTGVTTCDHGQCDRLQNISNLSTICWKCDFFGATFHCRIPLNISSLILNKICYQLSCRLALIRRPQAVITSFSVIVLWTKKKWNIILWFAGRLLKSRKVIFSFKKAEKNEKTHGAAFNQ